MMETPGGGILGRLGEKVLGWIAIALLIVLGVAIYRIGPAGRQALWEGIWRTCAWIIVAAALPWSARLFIGRVLEIGSNWAGAVVLAAFSLVNAASGAVLLQGLPAGGWGWTAAVAALAVAGTYNFLVTEYLSERAGG